MLLLKRSGIQLDRDVIFLAESGEEADTTGVGINFMVGQHFDEIDAEFAMTEGGGATTDGSRVSIVNIGTAEKAPRACAPRLNGIAGHGSVPRLDNALIHLGAAIEKGRPLGNTNEAERHHTDVFREARQHQHSCPIRPLQGAAQSPDVRRGAEISPRERPSKYSMLRTSVVPTMMQAGIGANDPVRSRGNS